VNLLVDAGPLVTQADRRAPEHAAVTSVLRGERGELIVSAFVAAEADYIITRRFGVDAELRFLDDLAAATYSVVTLSVDELGRARDLVSTYRDLELGLADASIVVLSARLGITRILTDDNRHFRAVTPLQGGHFTILPADA
jgi:predicted nucleic acid-binding protein